jgi:hypothetical protein
MVRVYELVQTLQLPLQSPEFEEFRQSYDFETEHGYAHFVRGDLRTRAGDVAAVVQALMAATPKPA